MVLVLDLGNTNIYLGIFENGQLIHEFRKHTDLHRSSDEYVEVFKSFFLTHNIDTTSFEGGIISSVVPSLTTTLKSAIEYLINKPCLVVGKGVKTGLSIKIDNPSELGCDLVCDCVGAVSKYPLPLIIADLGTANKILVVDSQGAFIGCTISVGLKLGIKSLTNNAAQLMDVSLLAPKKVIGKNSQDSLNSGAIYGTVSMIEGMAKRIENELNVECNKVITGGNAILIKDYIDGFVYDPTLILEGLYRIYEKNK
ncbi:MAG: type III pantothenate kinase [Erysipelotrichaceae bacterium]|nr:type III pantothenate kinase [Erysipelotrichaceae bacterium]